MAWDVIQLPAERSGKVPKRSGKVPGTRSLEDRFEATREATQPVSADRFEATRPFSEDRFEATQPAPGMLRSNTGSSLSETPGRPEGSPSEDPGRPQGDPREAPGKPQGSPRKPQRPKSVRIRPIWYDFDNGCEALFGTRFWGSLGGPGRPLGAL